MGSILRHPRGVWKNGRVFETRATLAKRRADVAQMFDGVAQRYDLMNDVLTFGLLRQWRRDTVEAVDPKPGHLILDLAGGTGSSAASFAVEGAEVFPTDLSLGMLRVGRQRQPGLQFVAGDALQLPFADNTFDTVTISYGLRNVEDTVGALREMLRVTKPGGQVVICEFTHPTNRAFAFVYEQWLPRVLPLLSKVSSNPAAYEYLFESILAWPPQEELAELMSQAGWQAVGWRNLSQGIVALHRGWKA
ncbi:demethylmenaquinone methyltransferase [Luteococcus sp. H138]|uniref:demethylmenaquinone methyltransferase n=1 Tax=unclassified Luteococcus TaxID=2639923 RepID=UPI00313A806C